MCECNPPWFVCTTHLIERIEGLVVTAAKLLDIAHAFQEELSERVELHRKDNLN